MTSSSGDRKAPENRSASGESRLEFPSTGRLAGIDYGTKRIGIAITDPGRCLASPLTMYERQDELRDGEFFRRLAAEERVAGFVVGLPIHLSGDESQKSFEARQFGTWLAQATGLPVCYFDERFTTREARAVLSQSGSTRKRTKKRIDMLAAQRLLADFLETGTDAHQWRPESL